MSLASISLVVLCASSQVRLASPGFTAVNVDPKVATFFADHFAQQVQLQGVRVVTGSEIAALIGFERQRELLGCADSESSSCIAELSGALGVDGFITGSVAKVGSGFVINIKVVAARDAKPLGVFSSSVFSDEQMVEWLGARARDTVLGLGVNPSTVRSTSTRFGLVPWFTIVGGVMAAGAGLGLQISARQTHTEIVMGRGVTADTVEGAVSSGRQLEVASWVMIGIGAAAITTAIVMLVPGRTGPSVALVPGPGGGVFTLTGALP